MIWSNPGCPNSGPHEDPGPRKARSRGPSRIHGKGVEPGHKRTIPLDQDPYMYQPTLAAQLAAQGTELTQ